MIGMPLPDILHAANAIEAVPGIRLEPASDLERFLDDMDRVARVRADEARACGRAIPREDRIGVRLWTVLVRQLRGEDG